MTDEKKLWLKTGGGPMYLDILNDATGNVEKKLIKGGRTFRARESEVPKAFRDLVKLAPERHRPPLPDNGVDPIINDTDANTDDKAETVDAADIPKAEFQVEEDETPGWYNVVNLATGNKMNEKKMREADATNLAKSLSEA